MTEVPVIERHALLVDGFTPWVAGPLAPRAARFALMGLCGSRHDPHYYPWRAEVIAGLLEQGVSDSQIDNPEMSGWTVDRVGHESEIAANDQFVFVEVPARPDTEEGEQPPGRAAMSLMEAGVLTFGGLLRGQDVITHVELDERASTEMRVARQLALAVATEVLIDYPHIARADSLADMVARGVAALVQFEEGVEPARPPLLRRTDLAPVVYAFGSSGPRQPAWLQVVTDYINRQESAAESDQPPVPLATGYRPDWSPDNHIQTELTDKRNSAVLLVGIGEETPSYGTMAELGWLLTNAYLTGQTMGILLRDYVDPQTGVADPASRPNLVRKLLRAHLNRLFQDFPDLPLFITDDPKALAAFGVAAYRHRQGRAAHELSEKFA